MTSCKTKRGSLKSFGACACWLVLLGAAFASSACGGPAEGAASAASPEKDSSAASLIGNRAPDFDLRPLSGPTEATTLTGLRGHVVVLDFWGTYCGPCKQSFPKLQELHEKYARSGLRVIGVSEDEADDRAKIVGFAGTYGAKFTIAWDEDRSIARRYRPEVMPSTYIIDKNGVVQYAHAGYRSGDDLVIRKEVEALLGR